MQQPPANRHEEGFKRLREFRAIGATFMYLGRTCLVTGHTAADIYGSWPQLQFDYVDDIGVIHSGTARVIDLPLLISQQAEPK